MSALIIAVVYGLLPLFVIAVSHVLIKKAYSRSEEG